MNGMSRNTSMSFLLLGLGLLSACGGDDKPAERGVAAATRCPPGQCFDGRFCQTQGAAPGATTAPPATTPPPATAGAPGALPVPIATAAAGPTATPLDPTAAQAATQLIAPLGQQHAV